MELMDKRGVPLEVGQTVAAATSSYRQTNMRLGEISKINPETRKVTIRTGAKKYDCSVVNVASPGQTFVDMYTGWCPLQGLLDGLREVVSTDTFDALPALPGKGTLDLSQVIDNAYFFS